VMSLRVMYLLTFMGAPLLGRLSVCKG